MVAIFKELSDGALRIVQVMSCGYDVENSEFWLSDAHDNTWVAEMSQYEAERYIRELYDFNKIDLTMSGAMLDTE